jgi:hypothetical protein
MALRFISIEGGMLVVDKSTARRQPVSGRTKSVRHTKVKTQKFLEPLKVTTTREGAKDIDDSAGHKAMCRYNLLARLYRLVRT